MLPTRKSHRIRKVSEKLKDSLIDTPLISKSNASTNTLSEQHGKKKSLQFQVSNHIIATDVIVPIEDKANVPSTPETADSEPDTLFSPLNSTEYHEEEEDEELEFTFPSYPKRFHRHHRSQPNSKPTIEDSSLHLETDDASSAIHIETLLHTDEGLTNNEDFWREVGTSFYDEDMEHVSPKSAALSEEGSDGLQSPLENSPPLYTSHYATSNSEPSFIEDFIADDSANPAASDEALFDSSTYQFKRLCYRDSEGKLALTTENNHIRKPYHRGKKRKNQMKQVLRRKSGFWEMVCPSVGIGEFMLL